MSALLNTAKKLATAQAMWGTHVFMRPGQKADNFSSGSWDGVINYKREIDAQQQTTTEAQNPINNKGDDKQKSFSINIEVNKFATGRDPLTVHKQLKKSLGKKSYFFIGSIPIDNSYYYLKSAELRFSNIDIAADGSVYRAFIVLEFVEDVIMRVNKKTSEKSKTTGKQTASKIGATKEAKKAEIEKWQKELFG